MIACLFVYDAAQLANINGTNALSSVAARLSHVRGLSGVRLFVSPRIAKLLRGADAKTVAKAVEPHTFLGASRVEFEPNYRSMHKVAVETAELDSDLLLIAPLTPQINPGNLEALVHAMKNDAYACAKPFATIPAAIGLSGAAKEARIPVDGVMAVRRNWRIEDCERMFAHPVGLIDALSVRDEHMLYLLRHTVFDSDC